MNKFIKIYRDMAGQRPLYEQKARELIIEGLVMRQPGSFDSAKTDDVRCVPGSVYVFNYNAVSKTELTSQDTGRKISFSDGLPVVLVTEVSGDKVTGFNLNLCRSEFKCLLLNAIFNLQGKMDTSGELDDRVRRAVTKLGDRQFLNTVLGVGVAKDPEYRKATVDILLKTVRNYSLKNMMNVKHLETSMWRYIPFLNIQAYSGIQKDLHNSGRL